MCGKARGEDHLRRGLELVFNCLMKKRIIRVLECRLTSW